VRDPLAARGPDWRTRLRARVRRLGHRTGRRGAFLLFLAVLDLCYGYALTVMAVAPLKHAPSYLLPVHVWGWIWIGTGAVCASGVFMARDWPQFTVAAAMQATWGLLWADLWIVQGVPGGWVSITVWLSFGLTTVLIGGWPEPAAAVPSLRRP
jgi:hypothetical protein